MIIIDSPQVVRAGQIVVPPYLRGHLSLKSGTDVTVCLLPRGSGPRGEGMPEVVVTPVKFESWSHVWRLKAIMYERPGVVRRVLAVLRRMDVNVLCQESFSVDQGSYHSLELIIDVQNVAIHPRAGQAERSPLDMLRNRLIAVSFNDLVLDDAGSIQLRLEPLQGFRTAKQAYIGARDDATSPPPQERVTIHSGTLTLPSRYLRYLRRNGGGRVHKAVLASETKDRLLHVVFPPSGSVLIYARISHNDKVGALACITDLLAQNFTILTSFSRLHNQDGRNHLEVLLTPTGEGRHRAAQCKAKLKSSLRHPNAASFDLQIAFPANASTANVGWQELKAHKRSRGAAVVSTDRELGLDISTDVIISALRHDITSRLLKPAAVKRQKEDEARLRILDELQRSEGMWIENPDVFVSYSFQRSDYFDIVARISDSHAFHLVTGKDPWQATQFRDEIIRRIQNADGFIGIWDGSGREINSWLLWEFGVAQAFDLPFRLLIAQSIDDGIWKGIIPAKHNFIFRDTAFESQAKKALNALKLDIQRVQASSASSRGGL